MRIEITGQSHRNARNAGPFHHTETALSTPSNLSRMIEQLLRDYTTKWQDLIKEDLFATLREQ